VQRTQSPCWTLAICSATELTSRSRPWKRVAREACLLFGPCQICIDKKSRESPGIKVRIMVGFVIFGVRMEVSQQEGVDKHAVHGRVNSLATPHLDSTWSWHHEGLVILDGRYSNLIDFRMLVCFDEFRIVVFLNILPKL
jgi:hypothetical protein